MEKETGELEEEEEEEGGRERRLECAETSAGIRPFCRRVACRCARMREFACRICARLISLEFDRTRLGCDFDALARLCVCQPSVGLLVACLSRTHDLFR